MSRNFLLFQTETDDDYGKEITMADYGILSLLMIAAVCLAGALLAGLR